MIWLAVIIGALILLVILIVAIIRVQLHKKELKKYYVAAQRIIQEECLNYAIKNPIHIDEKQPRMQKLMICLKIEKTKQQFVFDPEHGVSIGRNNAENDICPQDMSVARRQCRLFLYNNQIWLQDLNSSNGTWVKRGIHRPIFLKNQQIVLNNRDQIYVGGMILRIEIFFCDLLSA